MISLPLVICQLSLEAGCRPKPAIESCSHGVLPAQLLTALSQALDFESWQLGLQLRLLVMMPAEYFLDDS